MCDGIEERDLEAGARDPGARGNGPVSACPVVTGSAPGPPRSRAQRDGGVRRERERRSTARPASSSTTGRRPRTTSASTNGAGDAFSTSITTGARRLRAVHACTASPPGTRIAVRTTGMSATRSGARQPRSREHATGRRLRSTTRGPAGARRRRTVPPSTARGAAAAEHSHTDTAPITVPTPSPDPVELGLRRAAHELGHEVGRGRRPSITAPTIAAIGISTPWCARELEHRTGGPHALGDHRRVTEDLVERTAPAELDTDPRLRLCSLVHVATRSPTPASPANVSGSPPTATPRRVSSASPRVMSAASRVVAEAEPGRGAAAIAITFFIAPAISQPDDVGVRVHAERLVMNSCCSSAPTSRRARDHRRRGLALRDLPARFGPVSTATPRASTRAARSSTTSAHAQRVPCSMPLVRLTTRASAAIAGAAAAAPRGTRATAPPSPPLGVAHAARGRPWRAARRQRDAGR